MDFTREPLIQTVITPKEGCKIVVRSSKNSGQEEYFVDAVEVVSFGTAIFFRSLERPKAFLVPVSDYEILEVREARMVLKNVGVDRAIKIGGGRDAVVRGGKEHTHEKQEASVAEPESEHSDESPKADAKGDVRIDKKRDRRRNARRRRGREETVAKDGDEEPGVGEEMERVELPAPSLQGEGEQMVLTSVLTSLLPPPPTLISETIARYRDNATFKNAFFSKGEESAPEESKAESTDQDIPSISLEQPEFGSFEMSVEEEEEIYEQRRHLFEQNKEMPGEESQVEEENAGSGQGEQTQTESAEEPKTE